MVLEVAAEDLVTNGDEEAVNADDRAATITESINPNIEVYRAIVQYVV
jgi:hypothetical protein